MARPRLDSPERRPGKAKLWRRRLAAVLLIAAMIAVPVYVFLTREDEDEVESSPVVKAATDPAAAAKVLKKRVVDKTQGIRVRFPADWRGRKAKRTVRVTSKDMTTGIGIVSQGRDDDAKRVFRAAINSLKRELRKRAKVEYPTGQGQISGLPTATAAISGADKRGTQRRTLLIVARGKRRSYVITVLGPPGGGQLGVANLILTRGLRLTD